MRYCYCQRLTKDSDIPDQEGSAGVGSATELRLRNNLKRSPAELHTVRAMLKKYAETITPLKAGERAEGCGLTHCCGTFLRWLTSSYLKLIRQIWWRGVMPG